MPPDVLSVVPILLSLLALAVSLYTFRVRRTDSSYADIDAAYLQLLKEALRDPELRYYEKTSRFYVLPPGDNFRLRYHVYAYMCWNLVETIFDRQKDRSGQFQLSDTWVPAIIEENRLHYTWFKHNLGLFKPSFQRFVTEKLNDIDLDEGTVADLDAVYARIEKDFPPAELIDRPQIELLMSKRRYKLLLAKHRVFGSVIGYAFLYEPEFPKLIWLDYMAIDAQFQNAGYGTLLFNKLAQRRKDGNLGVLLEVEIPDSEDAGENRERERRIVFYERLGAKKLHMEYRLPTQAGSHPLQLMFRPSAGVRLLPKDQIQAAIASAFEYIHSDVPHRDEVLRGFLGTIDDEAL